MSKITRLLRGLLLGALVLISQTALGIEDPQQIKNEVGVSPELGKKLDGEILLKSSDGSEVKLAQLLNPNKPTILIPAYYDCPRLCGLLLTGATELLNQMDLALGKDYSVLTVSFDPSDTPELAKKRQGEYYSKLKNPDADRQGWKFLTGEESQIKNLMGQIGFGYLKDGEEFAHSAVILVLTPEGEISQYFTGIEFPAWDVRLALVEAGKGTVGSAIDHFLLYCFHFDPSTRKYTWAAFNVMRVGGVLTLLGIGIFYYSFLKRKKRVES